MGVKGDIEDCWLVLGFVRNLGGSEAVKNGITGGFQGVLDPRKIFVRGISRSLWGKIDLGGF